MRYIFDRVDNGWLVTVKGPEHRQHLVSEDPAGGLDDSCEAESLAVAIMYAFEEFVRTKHRPGLVAEVRPGREVESSTCTCTCVQDCPVHGDSA